MFKKLNNKRGFSLVELMVVVAIMGTLASIAIPAFNSYRKSAKKTAYKSDLTALHKGWQAFGVELDSYCERETNPDDATITNVGMESLLTSKLYGVNGNNLVKCTGTCTAGTPPGSVGAGVHAAGSTCATGCTSSTVSGNGPGKHNFIGFGDTSCTNVTLTSDAQILGVEGTTPTTHDADCDLDVATYQMGVYGHISGADYFGISIDENGVTSSEYEGTAGAASETNCS